MESSVICLDTSVLIEYFRKEKKQRSLFYKLAQSYKHFAVSAVTEYEVFSGCNESQEQFWEEFFLRLTVLPFKSSTSRIASEVFKELKRANKLIEIPDILIAATAMDNNLVLATLNTKDFERINGLKIKTRV